MADPPSAQPRRPTREIPPIPFSDVFEDPLRANTTINQNEPHEHASPTNDPAVLEASTLTPIQAHYLKKTLVSLQFQNELAWLSNPPSAAGTVNSLSYLGPPFTPPPKSAPALDLPFCKFMFRQFVLSFPFLAAAPKDFFPSKFQPFAASLLSRNISFADNPLGDPEEESEAHAQEKILLKLEKHFSLILGSATKLVEKEQVVRLTQADLQRLEELGRRSKERAQKATDGFEVNVVCIRTVTEKGRVRSRVHDEFIIRTKRTNHANILVSRRYGDFRTLAEELRKAHPEVLVRAPPPKDRTAVSVPASGHSMLPSFNLGGGSQQASPNDSTDSIPNTASNSSSQGTFSAARLSREKNRLTLRSYLHSLLTSSTLASSPVLQSFLTSNQTELSADEEEDARRREETDRVRDDGRNRFAKEIAVRVETLRGALKKLKQDMMEKDGLTGVFAIVRTHATVQELPSEYQAVMEWARTSLASTIFQYYVASDSSSENLAGLKRIHGLMPYMLLKGILRISNPVGMIRGVLDLFLAQPFGGRSLLQRMFTSSLTEEVKALQEDIDAVEDKVDDPEICEKLRMFINAPPEIQEVYRQDALAENVNILTCILRSGEHPPLTRAQMLRIGRTHKAHADYMRERESLMDSDDDDGPQNEDAWLYEDLKVLAKLYARLRDREQLISLIFEGTTSEVLKDILTIFYSPLAQVYKAASIADSISDLQGFINDLIKTVEQVEEMSQEDAPRTVQAFLNLVQRHEQAFYHFVHKVHSKGENLFDSLIRWIELFLTLIREGVGEPISLEFILPHGPEARSKVLSEIDAVARYHYRLKVAYEEKLQRRFGKQQDPNDAFDADFATELVNGAVDDLSFGELVKGEADDIAAQESSEDSTSEEDSDSDIAYSTPSEADTDSSAARVRRVRRGVASSSLRPSKSMLLPRQPVKESSQSHPPPLPTNNISTKPLPPTPAGIGSTGVDDSRSSAKHQNRLSDSALPSKLNPAANQSRRRRRKIKGHLPYPDLKELPSLLPLFLEMVRPQLQTRSIPLGRH